MKKWARNFDQCVCCEKTKRKHYGRGMCMNCYQRWRTRTFPEYRKKQRMLYLAWRERNPARVKELDKIQHHNWFRRKMKRLKYDPILFELYKKNRRAKYYAQIHASKITAG